MKKILSLYLLFFCASALFSQGLVKTHSSTKLLLNDSSLFVNPDHSVVKPIIYANKEMGYHLFYNGTAMLHATFIKTNDYYIFEEYDRNGLTIARGKLLQNISFCKRDTDIILSPITLKATEKHITCYYSLIKSGPWEYYSENKDRVLGGYVNNKRNGLWKTYVNTDYLSNIKVYRLDTLQSDSNVNTLQSFSKDSLMHMINGLWYATSISKGSNSMLLSRINKDYSFDYSLKLNSDSLFERNKKFAEDNSPNNSIKGNWKWTDDNTLSLYCPDQNITLQFIYIDKKEIIVKEIHQQKI